MPFARVKSTFARLVRQKKLVPRAPGLNPKRILRFLVKCLRFNNVQVCPYF